MLTITRKDLLLTISDNVIPAMGSSDVPVKFVNDAETYVDFLIEPRVGYYVNGCLKSGICEYDTSSNIIKIPAEAFKNKGILVIAIALIDNKDSNHIEVTKELALEVTPAPNGTVVLPATDTWQTAVDNLVEQLYNQDYKPQFDEIEENLHNLVKEAQNQQNKANNQQTQIDNAIDVMGDYEIVQDNPTQIRFKKGDGTYGDTVNLGDNLASKSMVNAGYDTYSGNSYSGSASDYGIEIGKASGNYEQVTTNGYQLFDQSKISTITRGGITITNNGDGSLSFNGTSTGSIDFTYNYSNDELKRMFKVGKIYAKDFLHSSSYTMVFRVYNDSGEKVIELINNQSRDITQEMIDGDSSYAAIYIFINSGQSLNNILLKPMLYQDGNGTWEPFTGGEPSPNPDYKQDMKAVEFENIISINKNLFNENLLSGGSVEYLNGIKCYKYKDNATNYQLDLSFNNKKVQFVLKTICYRKSGSTLGTYFQFIYSDRSIDTLMINTLNKEYIFTSNPNKILKKVTGFFNNSQNVYIDLGKTQLSEYPFANENVVSEFCKIPFPLTLRALPNGVKDTYENGVVTRRIGVVTYDGSGGEDWHLMSIESENTAIFYLTINNANVVGIGSLTNKLQYDSSSGDFEHYRWSTSSGVKKDKIVIFIQKSRLTENSVNGLKTYLQSNPITVWYELAEPTIEQVDLPVIPSYFPYTNAWHDSEVEASDLTWNILARQYGSGQTTIKKDEAVLTELDLNTERTATPTTVKVQLQDSEGKVLYLETSSENVYIQSGRFSGKTVQQVLENSIQAISATDEYIEVDVPDSMTQSIDEEFLVDEVDESETETG